MEWQATGSPNSAGMTAISFTRAREIIESIAKQRSASFASEEEVVELDHAVGRTVKNDLIAPISTPTFDSSAMDGYAVLSRLTSHAAKDSPLLLRVVGSMAAGSEPIVVDDSVSDGYVPCIEIMTGAPFPVAASTGQAFDACIPWEHTRTVSALGSGTEKILQIDRPPVSSWHKRIAGGDFTKGHRIIEKGTLIAPKHIMALASVGIGRIAVMRNLRVGVLSTGSELSSSLFPDYSEQGFKIPDANGPYLTAALREMGAKAFYLGVVPDNVDILTKTIRDHQATGFYDVLVSSGGVSVGKFDYIPDCIANLGGTVHFHNVAMRPGYQVLFASLPNIHQGPFTTSVLQRKTDMAFFGLPGNPVASAVCFRFLVTPYARELTGMLEEREIMAKVALTPEAQRNRTAHGTAVVSDLVIAGSADFDIFRHANLTSTHDSVSVEISKERSPAKTSPFVYTNCWVHIPAGHTGGGPGDVVTIYPFCSPKT